MSAVLPTTAPMAEPTALQLQLAFRHISRPGWPSTLEAALQIHHYRVCLTAMARQLHRPAFNHRAPPQPVAPTPAAAPVSAGIRRRLPYSTTTGSAGFAGKCAAANDRSQIDD